VERLAVSKNLALVIQIGVVCWIRGKLRKGARGCWIQFAFGTRVPVLYESKQSWHPKIVLVKTRCDDGDDVNGRLSDRQPQLLTAGKLSLAFLGWTVGWSC